MRSRRPFLFGLGIGIVVGAILLQLMMLSSQELVAPGEDQLLTPVEVERLLEDREAAVRSEYDAIPESDGDAGDDTGQSSVESEADAAAETDASAPSAPEAEPAASQPESVTVNKLPVRIKEGMNLTQIARLLQSKGVITDEQVFLVIMQDYSKDIVSGFYFFDGTLTPADVKRIIIAGPFSD